jgi:hypothetical protein
MHDNRRTIMKSRKISDPAAREITTRIVKLAFEAEQAAFAERSAALSTKVSAAICSDEQAAIIRALPPHLQPSPRDNIYVETESSYSRLHFQLSNVIFCNARYVGLTELGPELFAECCVLYATERNIERRQHEMATELLMNIRAASTTSKLIEAWPEVATILFDYYEEAPDVETPLESILGRHLAPALPAPQPASTDTEQPDA